MTRAVSVLVTFAIAVVPVRALADAKSEARTRMEHAMALHTEGKFAEALVELMTAYSLDPRPDLLYAIAQTQVQLGNCPQAITFYQRFLSTRPDAVPAAAAREAIDTCKTNPVAPVAPVAPVEPAPKPEPVIAPPPTPPPERPGSAPWYRDTLGDALVGGGIVLGVAAVVSYRLALGDLDAADAATDYRHHADLVDSARDKRTIATVFAIGGGALVGAGVVRFVVHGRRAEHHGVAILPAPRGGFVSWTGRF